MHQVFKGAVLVDHALEGSWQLDVGALLLRRDVEVLIGAVIERFQARLLGGTKRVLLEHEQFLLFQLVFNLRLLYLVMLDIKL